MVINYLTKRWQHESIKHLVNYFSNHFLNMLNICCSPSPLNVRFILEILEWRCDLKAVGKVHFWKPFSINIEISVGLIKDESKLGSAAALEQGEL